MGELKENASEADESPIFEVEEERLEPIRFRLDDILAFLLFWALGIVTFLQFFSRYVLNDSIAWTEEISRYLLMLLTFFGTAIVFRKRTNISIDLFVDLLPALPGRLLRLVSNLITLGFVILLVIFAWQVTGRVAIQRMTVVDLSMSVVYTGVTIGCLVMLWRAVGGFIRNARNGWRQEEPDTRPGID